MSDGVTTFSVTRAVLDPEKPHLMWVLIKGDAMPGDYVARLWYTLDGSNPQDWRNNGRALAHFDCREIEGSPADEQYTTIVTGLKANGCEFGLPFHLGANIVAQTGIDQTAMTFFVEFCQETDEDELHDELQNLLDETSDAEPLPSMDEVTIDCEDEWHELEFQTTACPACNATPF